MKKKNSLFIEAISKFAAGVVLMGALLFLPAGTLRWRGGLLLMGLLFLPMFMAGLVMLAKAPHLLERRLQMKEEQMEQKQVVAGSAAMFLLGFVAAGLDFRFGWTQLPPWVTAVAAGLFLLSYLLYAEVLRENVWLSRTVEVQEGQQVVSTGLYGVVRHPMYAATVLLFLSMPLVLGSLISFVLFLVYPILIAKRIRNEEQVLEEGLPGYSDYKKRVKYRMIPFIW